MSNSTPNSSSTLPEHQDTFQWTKSPNPGWKIGDGLGDTVSAQKWREDEEKGWKEFDPEVTDGLSVYQLLNSGVVPRPVGFVSTISEQGVPNLAPFSWFQVVSATPPILLFSAHERPGSKGHKDSVANAKATKNFTVNLISEPWVEASNFTSVDAPNGTSSEWIGSGLRQESSKVVKAPWVRESAFVMECELYDTKEIFNSQGSLEVTVVYGLVKLIRVKNAVLTPDNLVDPESYKPVLRLAKGQYATLGNTFTLPRQRWAEVKDAVAEVEKEKL